MPHGHCTAIPAAHPPPHHCRRRALHSLYDAKTVFAVRSYLSENFGDPVRLAISAKSLNICRRRFTQLRFARKPRWLRSTIAREKKAFLRYSTGVVAFSSWNAFQCLIENVRYEHSIETYTVVNAENAVERSGKYRIRGTKTIPWKRVKNYEKPTQTCGPKGTRRAGRRGLASMKWAYKACERSDGVICCIKSTPCEWAGWQTREKNIGKPVKVWLKTKF